MRFRPLRTLRHVVAALLLLMAAAIGGEVYLRTRATPSVVSVCGRAFGNVQSLLQPSPVCHHEMRPGVSRRIVTGQHGVAWQINIMGCRGEEPTQPKPPGVYRILFLGDDTVCGVESDEKRTLPDLLERLLNGQSSIPVEVINAGLPGGCPLLSWLRYERELYRLKPDLVILHFDMTDVSDDMYYRRFLTSAEGLPGVVHPSAAPTGLPPSPAAGIVSTLKQSAAASWLLTATQHRAAMPSATSLNALAIERPLAWITDDPPDLRIQVRHALEPIAGLHQTVQNQGASMLVTTCPVVWQVTSAEAIPDLSDRCGMVGSTPYTSRLPFEVLRQYCRMADISFVDSSSSFLRMERPGRLFSKSAPIPSASGAALYARDIAALILPSLGKRD